MRKKSHISLARYLVRHLEAEGLEEHQKAFYLGNILPDCRPSFLTKKHEFSSTFEEIKEKIESLICNYGLYYTNARAYFRNLGEVMHYIADYFTFPHNKHYHGTLKEHCKYEKYLKWELKDYIRKYEEKNVHEVYLFKDTQMLFDYIAGMHQEYKETQGSMQQDCEYIVRLCQIVAAGILHLLGRTVWQTCGIE